MGDLPKFFWRFQNEGGAVAIGGERFDLMVEQLQFVAIERNSIVGLQHIQSIGSVESCGMNVCGEKRDRTQSQGTGGINSAIRYPQF